MSTAVFSLKAFLATSSLQVLSSADICQKWSSLGDCLIRRPPSGNSIDISPCDSYTASELDAFGVPFRFRFEEPYSASDPEYDFVLINGATVAGHTGALVNREGHLILESLFPLYRSQPFETIQNLDGFEACAGHKTYDEDVFIVYGGGGFKNFWHFHVDMLPVITFLREIELLGRVKLAVPQMRDWHREAFKAMGVEKDKILEIENCFSTFRRACLFSTIYQPTLTIPNELARKTMRALRKNQNTKNAPLPFQSQSKLLYVSRTDSSARMMVNEDSLISSLKDLGFEIAILSNLSYSEQQNLFASSKVIVGAHGAGLTNIVVADQNSLLVEIFPFGLLNAPHYHFLAKTLGIKYEMFVSKLKPSVSPHEYWTLEVEMFLFRLICILERYGFADIDVLISRICQDRPQHFSGMIDVMFNSGEAQRIMKMFGFSGLEDWGCWATEKRAAIRFNFPLPKKFKLELEVDVFEPALSRPIYLKCGISEYVVNTSTKIIKAEFANPKQSSILWIEAPGAVSPVAAYDQPFGDGRSLSLAVKRISIIDSR